MDLSSPTTKYKVISESDVAHGVYTLEEENLIKLEEERLRQEFEETESNQRELEEIVRKKVEDEEYQLRLDKEAASSILAEVSTNDREWRSQIQKEEDEEYEFFLEFGCYPYQLFESDSDAYTD